MALSKVGSGASVEWINSTGTRNLTQDTGTAVGDFALVEISGFPNGTTVSGPVGFTAVTPFIFDGSGLSQSTNYLFWRQIDGTETVPYACTFTGGSNPFGTAVLTTLRGDSALTFVSATNGTPSSGSTSAIAPSVSGTAGQGLIAAMATGDPTTMTTPSGMAAGTAGLQNTNTCRTFFETLSATGATGTRTSTLGTSRSNGSISILLNGATAGGTDDTANPTGVAGTGAAGTLSASGAANTSLTGVAGTGAVGTLTASIAVTAAVTGVSATGAAGTVTEAHGSSVTLSGVAGTGATSALAPPVHFTIEIIGVSATGSAGTVSQTHTGTVALTGVSGSGLVGSLSVSASGSVNVSLSGVEATGGIGSLTAAGAATANLTGVEGTGAIGTLLALGSAVASATGVSATGAVGTITTETDGSVNVPLTGVQAVGAAGDLTLTLSASLELLGVGATGTAGVVVASTGVYYVPESRTIQVQARNRVIRV
jgi:hypothetical protein